MVKRWLAVIAMIATAACEDGVPRATASADAAGKAFADPRPDQAALYIVSPERTGVLLDMMLDQRVLGVLGHSTYLRTDVTPGSHSLRCRSTYSGDPGRQLQLTLKPGSTTYIYARTSSVNAPVLCQLSQMDAGSGRSTILTTTRIQEVGGASD